MEQEIVSLLAILFGIIIIVYPPIVAYLIGVFLIFYGILTLLGRKK
jgi:hypothetical protein